MRFTTRDLLWLTALVATGLAWLAAEHRCTFLKTRLRSEESRVEQLKSQNDTIVAESKTHFATFEALATSLKQADLLEEQRDSIRNLFKEELQRLGVKIVDRH